MRRNLALIFLLGAQLLAEPSASDRYKYAPVVAAAKLWNLVRYLHPRLSGDSTAWDSALIAALPKIESAHSDDELAVALDGMLETLHDPCTRIARGLPGPTLSVQSLEGDIMVIKPGNGDLAGSVGPSLMLQTGLPQTHTVIWDLRGSRLPPGQGRPSLRQLNLSGIGYAYRQHSGYPPPDGGGAGFFFSSLQLVDPFRNPLKTPETAIGQVYLVDKRAAVPVVAIMNQFNGRTAIVSEESAEGSHAGYTELVPLLGKVVAEVRVAELRYPDGTTEFAPSRVVLNSGGEAVKALAHIAQSREWGTPGQRPKFEPAAAGFRDAPYAETPYPSREHRILSAIRIWGIFHYFHPSVSLMGDKWDNVLTEYIPKFADAKDAREYHLAVAEMIAQTGDAMAIAGSDETRRFYGVASPPFEIRFIENQPVITHLYRISSAEPGDVIVRINGKPVAQRIDELSRRLAAPSKSALMNRVCQLLLNAPAGGPLLLTVRGKSDLERQITVDLETESRSRIPAHRSAESVRLLNERIGYVDMERFLPTGVDGLFAKMQNTKAIILDLRGYPRNSVINVAARLGEGGEPIAAQFVRNVVGPGAQTAGYISFAQSDMRVPMGSGPRYTGKTVALIDEASQAAEGAMFLKAANNTALIGTAATGSFAGYSTWFEAPGGIKIIMAGVGIRGPGGKLPYPADLQPDIEVAPTLAGIRAGRDEVLDRAIAYLSGN